MKLDEEGKQFIKSWEQLRLAAYLDGGGVETIGYGHTEGVKLGQVITEHQAEVIFDFDAEVYEKCVSEFCKNVNQNQFNALVSLCFNIGVAAFKSSTLVRNLKVGGPLAAAPQFARWCYDNGKVVAGLVNRRQAEKVLFLTGVTK